MMATLAPRLVHDPCAISPARPCGPGGRHRRALQDRMLGSIPPRGC